VACDVITTFWFCGCV